MKLICTCEFFFRSGSCNFQLIEKLTRANNSIPYDYLFKQYSIVKYSIFKQIAQIASGRNNNMDKNDIHSCDIIFDQSARRVCHVSMLNEPKFIDIKSKHLRIFLGNLRIFSNVFGNFLKIRRVFGNIRTTFG